MSTLVRIIIGTIITLFMTSCNFDINFGPGIEGNGNVITKKRELSDDFQEIAVSRGIEVALSQDNTVSIKVEADENLHDIITTEVIGNTLKISSSENIKGSSSKKVFLSVNDLTRISTTSGAYVYADTSFELDRLNINSTSGSHVDMDITLNDLKLSSSSGAGIKLKGQTKELNISSTSGSTVNAKNLVAQSTNVSGTSGASVSVTTEKALKANATSGANVRYFGNPDKVETRNNVSGSVRKQ